MFDHITNLQKGLQNALKFYHRDRCQGKTCLKLYFGFLSEKKCINLPMKNDSAFVPTSRGYFIILLTIIAKCVKKFEASKKSTNHRRATKGHFFYQLNVLLSQATDCNSPLPPTPSADARRGADGDTAGGDGGVHPGARTPVVAAATSPMVGMTA